MSGAWLTIPSAKPVAEAQACVDLWRSRGYKVALWRDQVDEVFCDLKIAQKYPGYAVACNTLIQQILDIFPKDEARWFICAGDDIEPDMSKTANQIADECETFFAKFDPRGGLPFDHTFGVMQPTGHGHGIETICGSAWIGREWVKRMYGGNGPLWHAYTHCFVDNELQEVAKLSGAFWQRPDLTHRHRHWSFEGKPMPPYLAEANSPQHWQKFMTLYQNRRAAGFPGHQPIAEADAA